MGRALMGVATCAWSTSRNHGICTHEFKHEAAHIETCTCAHVYGVLNAWAGGAEEGTLEVEVELRVETFHTWRLAVVG